MNDSPTITLDASTASSNVISLCCKGTVDSDGQCSGCELTAPAATAHLCSCGGSVNLYVIENVLVHECDACGARWHGEVAAAGFADSWRPISAPARYTDYLDSYKAVA